METLIINYWAVLACAVLSLVIGYVWYGPLFGKKWVEVVGATALDKEARKKMQAKAGPLYVVQFLLVLFQVYILAYYIKGWTDVSGITQSLIIWAAFIVPMIAGSAMWNNDSSKVAWTRFLLQSGYQLVLFVLFGFILGVWV
jgi:hypothetical protein